MKKCIENNSLSINKYIVTKCNTCGIEIETNKTFTCVKANCDFVAKTAPNVREVYVKVDVKERLPKEKGWYNLTASAFPNAAGRAYFDGEKFKNYTCGYNMSEVALHGYTLFWLELTSLPEIDGEKAFEEWWGNMTDRQFNRNNPENMRVKIAFIAGLNTKQI